MDILIGIMLGLAVWFVVRFILTGWGVPAIPGLKRGSWHGIVLRV